MKELTRKQIKPKHKNNLVCLGCKWALNKTAPVTTCPFVNSCDKAKKSIIVDEIMRKDK